MTDKCTLFARLARCRKIELWTNSVLQSVPSGALVTE